MAPCPDTDIIATDASVVVASRVRVPRVTRVATGALIALLAAGTATVLLRAASLTERYDAEVRRLRGEWRTQQAALGLTGSTKQKELYALHPTPEIGLCKPVVVAPGATAALTVPGKFKDTTTFVMENDQLQIEGGAVTPAKYTAQVTASPDAVPSFGRLYAYAPVSGAYNRCAAVVVGAAPPLALSAKNGWRITLTPQGKQFTVSDKEASMAYVAEYFKAGETTAFETTSGSLRISADDRPTDRLMITASAGKVMALAEELAAVQQQMSDIGAFMKKSQKEQQAIMAKMEAISNKISKEQEAMSADPAAAQKQQDEFGCGTINLTFAGAAVTGNISCGRAVGSLEVTGTRK